MFTHSDLWFALDEIAARNGLTPSGLARLAGLDSTALNKSKRVAAEGRLRWPSTESLAKILEVTNTSLEDFCRLAAGKRSRNPKTSPVTAARFTTLQALRDKMPPNLESFDTAEDWEYIAFPVPHANNVFVLEVSGNSLEPYYQDGEMLVVSPDAPLRRGDRVLFARKSGFIGARRLLRKTLTSYEFQGLVAGDGPLIVPEDDLNWVLRIVWVSQ
ncbi:S24 family peptidase [Pseudovibrio exalbescens]|uniref:S24 family peptidase n=1 Tax=Pseudovibrio exalbescens TaxID=197461 RepID=UPI0023654AA3|nr:S24 family peptidase [Pseudovibrio exalbescens]MDD7911137.1 S24 family peptidase [Pseudovibrio exalbescens]